MARPDEGGSMRDLGPDPNAPAAQRRRRWRLSVATGQRSSSGRSYVRRTKVFAGTKTEAAEELRRFHREVRTNPEAAAAAVSGVTVAQLLHRWLAHARDFERRSPNTIRTYEMYVTRRLIPAIGRTQLDRLGVSDVERLYGHLATDGLSPATIRQIHAILRRALHKGMAWGLVDRNVAALATPSTAAPAEIAPPTVAAVRALLDAARADEPGTYPYLSVAVATGARRAEVCGLRWDDLETTVIVEPHPETGEETEREVHRLRIARSTAWVDGLVVVKDPKTSRSRRHVTLDSGTVADLEAWRAEQAALFDGVAVPWMFARLDGRPWSPDQASARWERVRARAAEKDPSIRAVRLHDLRHWQATMLLDAGLALPTVAARLGHGDGGATTLRRYASRTERGDLEAARIIAELRGGRT